MIFYKSIYIPFVFCVLVIASCKPAQTNQETEIKDVKPAVPGYPSLNNQDISNLYAIVDKVDMIFYDMPISVNQDDAASAKNSVLYVSPAPVEINKTCKPLGRLSWISDGVIVREADFYNDSLCHYFIFMENNQPVAANVMAESGIQFFENIISQVQQRQK